MYGTVLNYFVLWSENEFVKLSKYKSSYMKTNLSVIIDSKKEDFQIEYGNVSKYICANSK